METESAVTEPSVPTNDGERPPVVFISYSWTTPAHEDRVREIATELRGAWHLDVRLDKWHLRTGEDAPHFMERMITEADKVLIVSDCEYARKANNREGGAGIEAQILTPELYRQGGGDEAGGALPKYAVVVTEYGADGKACRPTFYGGRIYIDMTDAARQAEKMREIALWAHDEQPFEPPPIGGRPDFLDAGPSTGTHGLKMKAVAALAAARPEAARSVEEYFDRLAEGLRAFVPELPKVEGKHYFEENLAPVLTESARRLGDVVLEVEAVATELARARLGERAHDAFRRFIEQLFPYLMRDVGRPPLRLDDWQADLFNYLVPDLFRVAVAALIQVNDFEGVFALTAVPFSVPKEGGLTSGTYSFTALQTGIRNRVLRESAYDIRRERGSAFTRAERLQTDTLLTLVAFHLARAGGSRHVRGWYPDWFRHPARYEWDGALPLFTRAESRAYLGRIGRAFGLSADELKELAYSVTQMDVTERRVGHIAELSYKTLLAPDRLGVRP